MSGMISRWVIILAYMVIFIAILVTVSSGMAQATNLSQQEEFLLLQKHLDENINKGAQLQEKINAAFRLAARPHSEYLLYQKGLGLQGYLDELENLQFERKEIIKKMGLQGMTVLEDRYWNMDVSIDRFPTYSGSPILSFNEITQVSAKPFSEPYLLPTGFFRFLMAGFLAIAFSFPLIALYKSREISRDQGPFVRVFPMFTVYQANGSRGLLKIVMDGQGKRVSGLDIVHAHLPTRA